jgi:hypothetical protein
MFIRPHANRRRLMNRLWQVFANAQAVEHVLNDFEANDAQQGRSPRLPSDLLP